jgi:hypothetical protein
MWDDILAHMVPFNRQIEKNQFKKNQFSFLVVAPKPTFPHFNPFCCWLKFQWGAIISLNYSPILEPKKFLQL